MRCVCPVGQQSNGLQCITCSGGKEWVPGIGCRCPKGKFDLGSSCEEITELRCNIIPDSSWRDGMCVCNEGFTKVGLQCVCYGVENGGVCDRCSQKPNSVWDEYFCRCLTDFVEIDGNCVGAGGLNGNDDPAACQVGSYFDSNARKCFACSDGSLSCVDSHVCTQCRIEFYVYQHKCLERCGDGKRFVVQCDDGNNNDGDGCSRDCYE